MDGQLTGIIIVGLSVTVPSVAVLTGYWMRLRSQRLARQDLDPVVDELHAELETVRAELGGQIAGLQERLDFAERLLTRNPAQQALPRSPGRPPA